MISNFAPSYPPIKSRLISHSSSKHTLVIEPLLPGSGHTLGNPLRRILFSSIPGSAVTRIRINDITHEYQSIPGVVEDALEVILNLKLLRCKILTDDEKVVLNLIKNSEGDVFASDFSSSNKIKVVNPDLYICSLNKDAKIDIEVEISRGVGYLAVESINLADNTNPQDIYVDAVFSPVINSSIQVEQVRVGDKTNFDKLEITFETDNSVDAQEVIEFILKFIIDLFSKVLSSFQASVDSTLAIPYNTSTTNADIKIENLSTDDQINLPLRIKNILEKNDIKTNADLASRIGEVEEFAGITEKYITTIKDYLKSIA